MTATDCPLCAVPADRFIYADELVVALWDAYAVSPGHALVVPRRHVASWFDATREERAALTDAVQHARAAIERRHRPDGYNIGVNVGKAGGQSRMHVHVHLIPRYAGDVLDPRGGIRCVLAR